MRRRQVGRPRRDRPAARIREQAREGAHFNLLVFHFERRRRRRELSDRYDGDDDRRLRAAGRTERRRFRSAGAAATAAAAAAAARGLVAHLFVGVVSGVGGLLAALAGVRALGGVMLIGLRPEDDLPGEGRQGCGPRPLLVPQDRLPGLVQAGSFLRLARQMKKYGLSESVTFLLS